MLLTLKGNYKSKPISENVSINMSEIVEYWGACPGENQYEDEDDAYIADCNHGFAPEDSLARIPVGRYGRRKLHFHTKKTGAKPIDSTWKEIPVEKSNTVCIAGGGIAGLYAAFKLLQKGEKVRLHESSAYLGGLLYTAKGTGDKNTELPLELGPSYFLSSHEKMVQLLKELDIETKKPIEITGKWIIGSSTKSHEEMKRIHAEMLQMLPKDVVIEDHAVENSEFAKLLGTLPYHDDIKFGTEIHAEDYFNDENELLAPWKSNKTNASSDKLGYALVVDELVEKIKNLAAEKHGEDEREKVISTNSRVLSVEAYSEGVKVHTSDMKHPHACGKIILAIPPWSLWSVRFPNKEHKKNIQEYIDSRWYARSARIYVVTTKEVFQPLITNDIRNVYDPNGSFGWAIVMNANTVQFYLDAEDADYAFRLYEKYKHTGGDSKMKSRNGKMKLGETFLKMLLKFLEDGKHLCEKTKVDIQEVYVGGLHGPYAVHHRIRQVEAPTIADGKIRIAGEAAGPSEFVGWTEGALRSIDKILLDFQLERF